MRRLLGWSVLVPTLVLGLAACAPEEPVTTTPESATKTIAAGDSQELPLSVQMKDSGFQFVTLPVTVRFLGLDTDVARELTLHAEPVTVELSELDRAEPGTVTVGVLPGTPPGEYRAHIVPDSPSEFVGGGDGLDLTVIVPEAGVPAPTAEPTTALTPAPTGSVTPQATLAPTPSPTPCDPDLGPDCVCDPESELEDCD